MTKEKKLHKSICKFIQLQYKDVYFLSDPSGMRVSIGLAVELKSMRSEHSQLDIVILEPNRNWNALIIEVKKEKSEVFKKNGEFRDTEHVRNQNKSVKHLNKKGYYADYVWSLNQAMLIINHYMSKR